MYRLLVINPGSTSTKVAVYEEEEPLFVEVLRHSSDELGAYKHILDQYHLRLSTILNLLQAKEIPLESFSAIAGRGGLLQPVPSGTYRISEQMLGELRGRDKEREHASNLGALLAQDIADRIGVPAFIVDPVCVDELEDLGRVSGLPEIERKSLSHALNIKFVARKAAADLGKPYAKVNLVVAHLGGGISVTAHRQGRMVDVNQALDGTGPFAPERAGGLPVGDVVRMCYGVSPYEEVHLNYQQMFGKLAGRGGLVAHLGTNSAVEVERRIEAGDDYARLVYEAMAYQIAKEIGSMSTVICGEVDAVVLTGGVAYSEMLVGWIRERVSWIAPFMVYSGEDEMLALALGALRVLRGDEEARTYPSAL
jgi:butyrate kinase